MVDTSDEILQKSQARIQKSLARVAKKKFAEKPEVCIRRIKTSVLNNIQPMGRIIQMHKILNCMTARQFARKVS